MHRARPPPYSAAARLPQRRSQARVQRLALIQPALDDAEVDRLMAFGADAAECEDAGVDEPYEVPPVHACWFEAA